MEKKEIQQKAAQVPAQGMDAGKSQTPPAFQLKADGKEKPAQLREGDGKEKVPPAELPYTQHKISNGAVTIPKDAVGALPVLVIYGGMVDRGGSYKNMMKWTPSNYYSSHILVFADHFEGYKSVKKSAEAIFKKQGVSPTYRAILGFSAGGMTAADAKGAESWGLIGMIDPAISGNFKGFNSSVYMVWDHWGGASQYKKNAAAYNKKGAADHLAREKARDQDEDCVGPNRAKSTPYKVQTDPDVVDPKNTDPRYKFHKQIKGGEAYSEDFLKASKESSEKVPGDSVHLPEGGHLNMPAAWFSKFGSML